MTTSTCEFSKVWIILDICLSVVPVINVNSAHNSFSYKRAVRKVPSVYFK
jgi:hypothetical protein